MEGSDGQSVRRTWRRRVARADCVAGQRGRFDLDATSEHRGDVRHRRHTGAWRPSSCSARSRARRRCGWPSRRPCWWSTGRCLRAINLRLRRRHGCRERCDRSLSRWHWGRIVTDDPLSGESLAQIGAALGATGWFEGAAVVRRAYRNNRSVIDVSGTWRVPVAVVRYDDLDYLVSKDGRLLPARYSPGASGMPVVIGVPHPPPGQSRDGRSGVR
jgi:hypothetical protein